MRLVSTQLPLLASHDKNLRVAFRNEDSLLPTNQVRMAVHSPGSGPAP